MPHCDSVPAKMSPRFEEHMRRLQETIDIWNKKRVKVMQNLYPDFRD